MLKFTPSNVERDQPVHFDQRAEDISDKHKFKQLGTTAFRLRTLLRFFLNANKRCWGAEFKHARLPHALKNSTLASSFYL